MRARSPNVAGSALAGTSWNFAGAILSSLASLTLGIFLARILGPQPYGQIILASTVYGFANLFVDGGLGQVLVQQRALEDQDVRRMFTLQVAFGCATTIAIFLSAPWLARMLHDASATPVIRALSFMIVLQSFGLASSALLRRQMQFKRIQQANLVSLLVGTALVTIPLALRGAGVWSLVAGLICQCALNSVLLYSAVRHALRPRFGLPAASMARFGSTIVATNLVNWGHANFDNLAASQLGPLGLGLYGRACNFAYQPVNAAVTSLQPVLLTSVARKQDEPRAVGNVTVALMSALFGVLGCAYAVLALNPDTTVLGLFGEKWRGVIPLLPPLAMAMPFYAVHCLLGPVVCGLGRPMLELLPQAISCGAAAVAFFAAGRHSIAAIAWALLAIMAMRFGLIATFAFRLLQIGWARVAWTLAKRGAFSLCFGAVAWSADRAMRAAFHLSAGPRLMLLAVFCASMMAVVLWTAGEIVVGRDALAFLQTYTGWLPEPCARRLRIRAQRQTEANAAISLPLQVRQRCD